MSSNLPPGVTDGMIPGNRPEDAEEERICEAITVLIGPDSLGEDALRRIEDHDLWWCLLIAYEYGKAQAEGDK